MDAAPKMLGVVAGVAGLPKMLGLPALPRLEIPKTLVEPPLRVETLPAVLCVLTGVEEFPKKLEVPAAFTEITQSHEWTINCMCWLYSLLIHVRNWAITLLYNAKYKKKISEIAMSLLFFIVFD